MKRSLLAIFLAASFMISGTSTTQALYGPQSSTTLAAREQEPKPQIQDNTTEEKQIELDARKTELEQKLADKRAAITKKLMGDRADKCQKKEVNINSILDKRLESAQKHYDTFESIETRLTALVKEKNITIENQSARELIIVDKGEYAQLLIERMQTFEFKCGDADATAPGALVKDEMAFIKQALKDYRDSIKEYAQAIKTSVEKSAETSPEQEPADEEAPVEDTPSTQQSIEGVSQ